MADKTLNNITKYQLNNACINFIRAQIAPSESSDVLFWIESLYHWSKEAMADLHTFSIDENK